MRNCNNPSEDMNEGGHELRRLADALDMQAIVELASHPIRRLERFMAKGGHLDPEAARKTKDSVIGLLDVIEVVCKSRRVSFTEVLAYLSPVDDLLVGLSWAASKGNRPEDSERTGETD